MILTTATRAALLAGHRVWDFRFARVQGDIESAVAEPVLSFSVACNDLAEKSKRTCKVTLPPDTTFDYLANSLRAYARLRLADGTFQEFCLGTFLLSIPSWAVDAPRGPVGADGFDHLVKWDEAGPGVRFATVPGISSYGALLEDLCLAVNGVVNISLPNQAYAVTINSALEWDPGTSYLQIANDLLRGIALRPLSVDELGTPYSTAYVNPADQSPVWTYTRDSDGMIVHGTTVVGQDLFSLPNRWVGTVSEPDSVPLTSIVQNDDPSSRTSTVRRGRIITRTLTTEEIGHAADQSTLDLIVGTYAAEAEQQFLEVNFETGMMPFHGSGDTIQLDYGVGSERFREVSWELDLRAGARMKHTARRVVSTS